jgi:septal ring factor EnvC (AmiA/AmiB activator)
LIAAGCEDKRVTNLEQRVKQLEERTRQLEAERAKTTNDDDVRRLKLENCVADANADFQKEFRKQRHKSTQRFVSNGTGTL